MLYEEAQPGGLACGGLILLRLRGGEGGCVGRLGPVFAVVQAQRHGAGLAVAELADNLQHLGPGGVGLVIDTLVGVDGHDEQELLAGHLAFLGGFHEVASAASRPTPAFQAGAFGCATLDHRVTSVALAALLIGRSLVHTELLPPGRVVGPGLLVVVYNLIVIEIVIVVVVEVVVIVKVFIVK